MKSTGYQGTEGEQYIRAMRARGWRVAPSFAKLLQGCVSLTLTEDGFATRGRGGRGGVFVIEHRRFKRLSVDGEVGKIRVWRAAQRLR